MKKINQLALLLQFLMMVNANAASCPTDFDYVHQISWDASSCSQPGSHNQGQCCQTLLSLLSIGLAQQLKDSSMFQFPDNASATACLNEFQQQLSPLLSPTLLHSCLKDTSIFVSSPSLCKGIQTKHDWIDLLGRTTAIDLACKGVLSDLIACNFCVSAADKVNSRLVGMNQNHTAHTSSRCFNFTVLYAAMVNENGPKSPKTAYCTFKLALPTPKEKASSRLGLISTCAGAAVSAAFVSAFILINCLVRARRSPGIMNRPLRDTELSRSTVRLNTDIVWCFSIDEIKAATHNFTQANLIGQGVFGTVYKGTLPDGQLIVVKRIRNCPTPEGVVDFLNEVEILYKIRHPNLVALRGCCVSRDDVVGHRRFLIYDYISNGNVDEYIFGEKSSEPLIWPQRKNIVLGIAKGLAYLHSGVQPAIYHRDIKPTNILLDDEMNARVSDFGLARIMTQEGGESQPMPDGSYLAPEHVLYGHLTEKSDVYSFGVVLLEIISGRKFLGTALEPASDYLLVDWAGTLVKANQAIQVVDERIRDSGPVSIIMMRFVAVGVLCAHVTVAYRPTIVEALKMLEGDIEIPEIPDRPLLLTQQYSLNRMENNYGFLNISASATSSPISPTEMLR